MKFELVDYNVSSSINIVYRIILMDNVDVMESSSNLECLVGNVDIAKHLMQFLSYEEQLNLSRVCKQFESLIINFIWKHKYRHVEFISRHAIHAMSNHSEPKPTLSTNVQTENWNLLNTREFDLFLKLNMCNIKHLKMLGRFSFDDDRMYQSFASNAKFPNLISLDLFGIMLSDKDLQMISHNCRRLDTLIIADCVNMQKQVLVLGLDVNVTTIANMKDLKSFTLKSSCIYKADMHMHNYTLIRNILRILNIPKLYLNVAIISDANAVYHPELSNHDRMYSDNDLLIQSNSCVELEIGQFHANEDFEHFSRSCLSSYTNLRKLTVRGLLRSSNINVSREFFDTIKIKLCKLSHLHLYDCAIISCSPLNSLQEILLNSCINLTCKHLMQILSSKNIKSFTSLRTKYSGQLQWFSISQSLQKVHVDFKDGQFIKLFEQAMPKLHSLIWLDECNHAIGQMSLCMPNIQQLNVSQGRLKATNELLHLRLLHTVTLSNSHNFRDVLKLLDHSNLKHLKIEKYNEQFSDITKSTTGQQLRNDLRTNIKYLDIPVNLFENCQGFWLDLVSKNGQLKLITSGYCIWDMHATFWYDLIHSTKFPTRINSLQLCGFKIGKNLV